MTVARSVSDVLDEHVTLKVECIDRLYLNVHQPVAAVNGVVWFLRGHQDAAFAFTAEALQVAPPLRILGMVSSPRGLPALDVELEQQHLQHALRAHTEAVLIELVWLDDVS